MDRYVCVHGHFYQPPRENPWLEAIELQDSALPYHDWNERVSDECYRPNTRSRMLDGQGWIAGIVNNYERMSFNFGPTLLSWMEWSEPDVYEAILEADRRSAERFSGHGSAMAQAYNHMIMPLANERDRRTQVVWGVRDFEFRFGRAPEGMWLPEAAADTPSLEALAEAGIRFTVLAPRQAARVRRFGADAWESCEGRGIDPSRAYLCRLPSGREISVFFYDGPISQAVAFERLLNDGAHFAERILDAMSDERQWPQLAHIATDGETYGHHHRHGDMALAVALETLDRRDDVTLTNYAEFLERHPPTHEVQIHEGSSWSCVHGVERWRSDCGCCTGMNPGWNQRWRGPLRAALDGLRDAIAPRFESEAKRTLKDPWAARDDYISLILDRSADSVRAFFERHSKRPLSDDETVHALRLLEMQRHAMQMYTSCGWFFDELSGIETVQVMLYAARVMQLATLTMGESLESEFEEALSGAQSNLPEWGRGDEVYRRAVVPSVVNLPRVGAHFAVSSLFTEPGEVTDLYCYTTTLLDEKRFTLGAAKLVIGRARIQSRITRASDEVSYAVLHAGDHVITGGSRWGEGQRAFERLAELFGPAFEGGDLAGVIRMMERDFEESAFSLGALFRDEQRRIAELISESATEQVEAFYASMHDRYLPLLRFLAGLGATVPPALALPGRFTVNRGIVLELSRPGPDLDRVGSLLESARRESVPLDEAEIRYAFDHLLTRLGGRVSAGAGNGSDLETILRAVELIRTLSFEVDLSPAQQLAYELVNGRVDGVEAWSDEERARIGALSDLVKVRRAE